jgi:hypothetical protein
VRADAAERSGSMGVDGVHFSDLAGLLVGVFLDDAHAVDPEEAAEVLRSVMLGRARGGSSRSLREGSRQPREEEISGVSPRYRRASCSEGVRSYHIFARSTSRSYHQPIQ